MTEARASSIRGEIVPRQHAQLSHPFLILLLLAIALPTPARAGGLFLSEIGTPDLVHQFGRDDAPGRIPAFDGCSAHILSAVVQASPTGRVPSSHTIETTLDLKGNEQVAIVACGGVNGGYTLFITDHKLNYDYNYFNSERYAIASSTLPMGKVEFEVQIHQDRNV